MEHWFGKRIAADGADLRKLMGIDRLFLLQNTRALERNTVDVPRTKHFPFSNLANLFEMNIPQPTG